MTTQEYLSQIARFESMIERKQQEVNRLDMMAHGIKSPTYDPDKVQTSLQGDKMSTAVAKLMDAQNEVSCLVDLYLTQRKYIISQIDKIPDRISYSILTDKYVEHKHNYEIACDLKYSERWVRKAHIRALKEFEKLYGQDYLDKPSVYA